ncbi:hypothetical protein A2454_04840 [Candidatus Peribacteria bacterium RIFOXYC2_FULL_55_14]|nr:MAG: hypothetical protein UY85_C0063G0003 [Candidatus Peribacteria bacterium GW2011_GWB1_54_5]KKW41246.1 MAG: hypothetical protein UY87_C0001G0027 [Candidatus Peribacteria bacterium GW2011_GWC2_54_8]KKW43378.1 MAG: hypothetical protein UY90_C0027G0017 [Candidatus Peregrinibacteria bacterium GW2011_GWA2_54_9]OGJ71328.1 MAG: hypothetical protein A2198_06005 [Candidatus Peribacteria bacterium RIFOXYA1_FULL_56_14]OGJ74329.1 MAG: hypothetical protein A2384_06400 [Candidatus Peribacteria bacterium
MSDRIPQPGDSIVEGQQAAASKSAASLRRLLAEARRTLRQLSRDETVDSDDRAVVDAVIAQLQVATSEKLPVALRDASNAGAASVYQLKGIEMRATNQER